MAWNPAKSNPGYVTPVMSMAGKGQGPGQTNYAQNPFGFWEGVQGPGPGQEIFKQWTGAQDKYINQAQQNYNNLMGYLGVPGLGGAGGGGAGARVGGVGGTGGGYGTGSSLAGYNLGAAPGYFDYLQGMTNAAQTAYLNQGANAALNRGVQAGGGIAGFGGSGMGSLATQGMRNIGEAGQKQAQLALDYTFQDKSMQNALLQSAFGSAGNLLGGLYAGIGDPYRAAMGMGNLWSQSVNQANQWPVQSAMQQQGLFNYLNQPAGGQAFGGGSMTSMRG